MKAMTQAKGKITAPKPRPGQRGVAPLAVRRRRPRAETRLQLIEAAGELIGEFGYAGCSISRVTAKAGIAHGAFYNHFDTQQQLFDDVLPSLGRLMFAEIGMAVADCATAMEVEHRGFEANFRFLERHPYMYRVLTEAELYAPKSYRRVQAGIAQGYARSLKRSIDRDGGAASLEELTVIATMLSGARTHLLMAYGVEDGMVRALPDSVRDQYFRFVESVLRRFEA